ncbi:MAG: hypothetical protein KC466_12535, partial [Myxococcales bacterium]|nr:hypothetical protein [Myxococcales bacterium]
MRRRAGSFAKRWSPFLIAIAAGPLIASGAAASPGAIFPDQGVDAEVAENIHFEAHGDYRFRAAYLSGFDVDAFGTRTPHDWYGEHRLRLEPSLSFWDTVRLKSQIDVWNGQLWGDTTGRRHLIYSDRDRRDNDGFDADRFRVRKLWLEIRTPIGEIRGGRMGSYWGLGLLANDGDGYRNDWGDARFGDIVDRVLFATKPVNLVTGGATDLNWIIAFAYDRVVDDDFANHVEKSELDLFRLFNGNAGEQDRADQYIVSTLYRSEIFDSGLYLVWRHQNEGKNAVTHARVPSTRDDTRVFVVDYYGRLQLPLSDSTNLFVEGEIAWITGKTQQNIATDSPNPPGRSDVDQLGGVFRGGYRSTPFDFEVEFGYASGDSNPFDDNQRTFRFDRDYNPSLILFEEVLADQTATAANNLSDPNLAGFPPENADNFPTNGSVFGAVYLKGTARARPIEDLLLQASVLYARSEEDVADPFSMNVLTGGRNANFLGGRGDKRELGWELDLGAQYTCALEGLSIVVGNQFGWLFPGEAFDGFRGQRMDDV